MSSYFSKVPNFDYVSRFPGKKKLGDYITVKNLFKRLKLSDDLISNLKYFTKYNIIGDERPDNVAFKVYGDETLDWVVLLSNNIIDVRTEWPLEQNSFEKYLLEKYGSYENLNAVHHYESLEVKNSDGNIIAHSGIKVDSNYTVIFYDSTLETEVTVTNAVKEVTNYEYEVKLQEDRRSILLLKIEYLNVVFEDINNLMPYKEGGVQYVNATLKRGEDIRLFE